MLAPSKSWMKQNLIASLTNTARCTRRASGFPESPPNSSPSTKLPTPPTCSPGAWATSPQYWILVRDASFDVVFFACVLHHVAHSEHPGLLAEAHRVLQPGGSLVVFEHNPYNPLTVHAVNTSPLDANAVLLTPSSLRRSAERAGFQPGVLRYCMFFPRALRALRPLERGLHWLPLGAQYSYHAQRS